MPRLFYTPPLAIIDVPADLLHHTKGRGGFAPELLIIHHTGGINSLKWLTTDRNSRVSAHRLIGRDGTNYKLVQDADTAWASGYGVVGPVDPDSNDPPHVAPNLNYNTLNIEIENLGDGRQPYTPAQMDMTARQVVEWWGMYGFLPMLGHAQVDSRKNDPRAFDWPWLHRLIRQHLADALVFTASQVQQ